jgi:hypothetical protein
MVDRKVTIPLFVGLVTLPLACGGRSLSHEEGEGTGSGGTSQGGTSAGGTGTGALAGASAGGRGGSSTTECHASQVTAIGTGVTLVPDCNGWFDDPFESVDVHGGWYPFGDQYPGPTEAKCIDPGMHAPEDCSIVTTPPPPPAIGFPQAEPGVMCTTGEVAAVVPCAPTVMTPGCPSADYVHVSGAGIAVDFNADTNEDGGAKHTWDPMTLGFVGFSFEIDQVPPSGLRVEIPMVLSDAEAAAVMPPLRSGSTTDKHPDGSPYWGASATYPSSPVVVGVNRVLWSDIYAPQRNYAFETRRMLGIQFHVPSAAPETQKVPYGFCIKNLTLLLR